MIVKGGNSALLRISQNGGNTFFSRTIAAGFNNNYQVVVLDSAIVTRVQSNGGTLSVQISFDTAQQWQALSLPPGFDPNVVTLKRSGKKGLFALIYGQYAWTTDYGAHWAVFSSPELPRELLYLGNDWLISTFNGFYRSSDAGATWTDVSTGFLGQVAYRVNAVGDKLYAQTQSSSSSDFSIYVTDAGSNEWVKSTDPGAEASLYVSGEASDTLVTFNQISLDGGQTWTYITYPNVSGFAFSDIEIHDDKAYVAAGFNIYAVPLVENPVAQIVYGPSVEDLYDLMFVGDSLYAANTKGHIFLQLPNTTDWIPLTNGGPGYAGKLFRINGRFFLPRWSDIRYSDDGIVFQTLPVNGLNVSPGAITSIYDMVGVGNVIIAATETGVGAYGPNDKQVWPGDFIAPDAVAAGVPLRYTIRFQNTGTYPAERVRLVDTLDANLDLSTLSVLGASHPYSWQVKGGRVLEIVFDQIQLPDSSTNQAASHGSPCPF